MGKLKGHTYLQETAIYLTTLILEAFLSKYIYGFTWPVTDQVILTLTHITDFVCLQGGVL